MAYLQSRFTQVHGKDGIEGYIEEDKAPLKKTVSCVS